MSEGDGYAWYWSIDIPGLTGADAARLAGWCDSAGIGEVGCFPGDPREVLTLHLDPASVDALARALAAAGTDEVAASLLATCREWLEWRGGADDADR